MAAHNVFRKIKNNWLIIFCVIIFSLINIIASSGSHLVHRTLFFVLFILVIKRTASFPLRLLFGIPVMLLAAADLCISLYAWCTFGTSFNYGFAISVLQSDPDEITKMLGLYIVYCIIFLALFALFLSSVIKYDVSLPGKKITVTLLLILIAISLFSSVKFALKDKKTKKTADPYIVASRFATYTPFFNLNYFALAAKEYHRLMAIADKVPGYQLELSDNGIDDYVLIVGESVRASNMSIYGHNRSTTPQLEKQKDRIKLFTQAISGAPYTALAVPLTLTVDTVFDHDIQHYPDNIINMANQAGFDTYWLSAQSAFRQNGTAVASIAMRAKERVYVRGYDELLLPHLAEALNTKSPNKKLIVLHLVGSHEPVCATYPKAKAVYYPLDNQDACYDNSIHYTDSILGQVFALLKNKRASVMYFADHGLERDPTAKHSYFHGGKKPSQEAYHVPMFIWYSPMLGENVDRSTVTDIFSTAYNDYLINAWMGVTRPEQPKTLKDVISHYQGDSRVIDGSHEMFDYRELRRNFNADKQ